MQMTRALSSSYTLATDSGGSVPTLTSVAAATGSQVLVAASANLAVQQAQVYIFNESTAIMYLAFGPTASTTAYTAQVAPNTLFVAPPNYLGGISAVWAAANGFARITTVQ